VSRDAEPSARGGLSTPRRPPDVVGLENDARNHVGGADRVFDVIGGDMGKRFAG
jgi:uncharacterized protein YbbK (DUF523 family)